MAPAANRRSALAASRSASTTSARMRAYESSRLVGAIRASVSPARTSSPGACDGPRTRTSPSTGVEMCGQTSRRSHDLPGGGDRSRDPTFHGHRNLERHRPLLFLRESDEPRRRLLHVVRQHVLARKRLELPNRNRVLGAPGHESEIGAPGPGRRKVRSRIEHARPRGRLEHNLLASAARTAEQQRETAFGDRLPALEPCEVDVPRVARDALDMRWILDEELDRICPVRHHPAAGVAMVGHDRPVRRRSPARGYSEESSKNDGRGAAGSAAHPSDPGARPMARSRS